MEPQHKIYKLEGKVQHYAWGGNFFIPTFLKIKNPISQPFAEYWLGAHSSASASLILNDGTIVLWHDLIKENPEEHIGQKVVSKFGGLPYLLKVLDVKEMLSIQVHPTKDEAIKGFEREETEGIAINAPNRNYKDKNHKPEVMIALSDFWLLHGFKKVNDLWQTLVSVPGFSFLVEEFEANGYKGLYKRVMQLPQQRVDEVLRPIIKKAVANKFSKNEPEYWISKLYNGEPPDSNYDRGIFSIYFLNIVRLNIGEAIFQAAGVPHAYLEGQNVELMANSDNVLRGGLTPKHIDSTELIKHIKFEATEPQILKGNPAKTGEINYPVPVDDFGISALHLKAGEKYANQSASAEIFLVMLGIVKTQNNLSCETGEAFTILANQDYNFIAVEDTLLYKAFVP